MILNFELNNIKFEISRIGEYSYYHFSKISIPISEDYSHIISLLRYSEIEGNYLNNAEIYAVLKMLFGESGKSYDDFKCSYSFPLILIVIKNNQSFSYLLKIINLRGSIEFYLKRIINLDDNITSPRDAYHHPFEDFTREEINAFISYFYGFMIGYLESTKHKFKEDFVKKVDSNLILFGHFDEEFFEKQYQNSDEFENDFEKYKKLVYEKNKE